MVTISELELMNRWILAAAIVSMLTFFIHVFGGGPEIHVPVLESSLSIELKAVLSVVWHGVSAMLLINSGALLVAARSSDYRLPLVALVSAQNLAFAVLFVFYGLAHLGTLLLMPQWLIFLALTGLSLAGLRSGPPKNSIGQLEKTP